MVYLSYNASGSGVGTTLGTQTISVMSNRPVASCIAVSMVNLKRVVLFKFMLLRDRNPETALTAHTYNIYIYNIYTITIIIYLSNTFPFFHTKKNTHKMTTGPRAKGVVVNCSD